MSSTAPLRKSAPISCTMRSAFIVLFIFLVCAFSLDADKPFGSYLGTLLCYGVAATDGTAPPSADLNQAGFLIRTETASRSLP